VWSKKPISSWNIGLCLNYFFKEEYNSFHAYGSLLDEVEVDFVQVFWAEYKTSLYLTKNYDTKSILADGQEALGDQ